MRHAIILGLAGLLSSGAALADPAPRVPAPAPEASITFANHGAIDNWQADGDQALYIKGLGRQWYHAKLMGYCSGLGFATTIGFDSGPTGDLDRYSTIIVEGRRCQISSLVESAPPPGRAKKKAKG